MDIINKMVDSMKDDIIKATQEIVGIRSVASSKKEGMPYGEDVNKALLYALNLSSTLGFKAVNVDGYMGYAEYGEGQEMIGVLGHLDVVPEGNDWVYPPFGGEIHDGKLYGRGSMDDKGPIIASLYGLKAIKDAKLPLHKRVRILFGTNEENGCKEVPYYLEREEAPVSGFTPDAEYTVIYAEKGILVFKTMKKFSSQTEGKIKIRYIKGGNAPNMVPDYCEAALEFSDLDVKKYILDEMTSYLNKNGYDISYEDIGGSLILKSKGASAHGSTPEKGKNAIMQLLIFLSGIDIEGEIKQYIDFFAANVGMETKGETLGLYLKDEIGELSFNIGSINLNESESSMYLNIRYPVTFKSSDVMDKFNSKIERLGLKVEIIIDQHPLYFPKDHPLIQTLMRVYSEQTGLEPMLLAIGGGTYAKDMPNIVAFGPMFPGKPDFAHQANEYIEVDDLMANARIYGNAIYELAR